MREKLIPATPRPSNANDMGSGTFTGPSITRPPIPKILFVDAPDVSDGTGSRCIPANA